MTKPLKPCYLPKNIPLPGKAAERRVAREMGLISGFFKKKTKSKGRPKNTMFMNSLPKKKKKSITPAASPANPVTIDLTTNLSLSLAASAKPSSRPSKTRPHSTVASSASRHLYKKGKDTKDTLPAKKNRSRGIYINWKKEPNKSALSRAVTAHLKGDDYQLVAGGIYIPPATFRDAIRNAKKAKADLALLDSRLCVS
jgi:hypothetical protein